MSKRALRRHHRARVVAHARIISRRWFSSWEPRQYEYVPGVGGGYVRRPVDHSDADARAVKFADHLAACSCASCGNPRRHGGFYHPVLTRQEQLADLQLREQLVEVALDDDED
jgi:hypothetical protein